MVAPVPHRAAPQIGSRRSRTAVEIIVYVIGIGVLFYWLDVLFMSWQGLALL